MLAIRKYLNRRDFKSKKDVSHFDKLNLAIDFGISFESVEKHLKLEFARMRRIQKMDNERLKKIDDIEKLKNFYNTVSIYPDNNTLKYLSDNLNMDRKKILRWFRNERHRNRSEKKMFKCLNGSNSNHFNKISY
jgi:hypothetical protein